MASTPHESMPRHVLYPALCNAGLDSVFLKGRMMIGLLNIATGLMILFIAKKIFGSVPSLCAFALYAFFPLFISNGTLTTADMAATFAFFLACAAYWTLFRKISVKTVLFAAAASFLLCISKFSAALMGPVVILFIVCKLMLRSPLKISLPFLETKYYQTPRRLAAYVLSIMLTGMIVWGAIWAAYFFRFDMYHNGAAPLGNRLSNSIWEILSSRNRQDSRRNTGFSRKALSTASSTLTTSRAHAGLSSTAKFP